MKTFFKPFQIASIIFILLFSSIVLADGYELEYEINSTRELKGEKTKKTFVQTIILLPTKFIVISKADKTELIYDFETNHTIYINHKDKTFKKESLFSLVAFKHFEMQNRKFTFAMLQEIRPETFKDPSFQQINLESLFGIKDKNSTFKNIKEQIEDDVHHFTFDGEKLASFSYSDQIIPNNLEKSFSLYITYLHTIHPDLKNLLLKKPLFPKNLSYTYYPMLDDVQTTSITLIKGQEYRGNDISIPDNYKEKHNEWLNKLANKIANKSLETSEKQYTLKMQKLLQEDKMLDVYLLSYEHIIQYGSLLEIEKTGEIRKKVLSNQQVSTLDKALTPKSKEEVERSIEIVKKLANQNLEHGYVLNIVLGNFYKSLRNFDEAFQYFSKALDKNPFLTGVYIDLGNLFINNFDMNTAWVCFDFAIKIEPNHLMLKNIKDNEESFKKLYPDHFLI